MLIEKGKYMKYIPSPILSLPICKSKVGLNPCFNYMTLCILFDNTEKMYSSWCLRSKWCTFVSIITNLDEIAEQALCHHQQVISSVHMSFYIKSKNKTCFFYIKTLCSMFDLYHMFLPVKSWLSSSTK